MMKKKPLNTNSYILIFIICCFSCTPKQTILKNTTLSFENRTYNFKEIPVKKEVLAVFYFLNAGKEPLLIKDVRTSCGCTVPEWTKEKLKPNEKGEIKIVYDAKYPGYFNKTISVFYNGIDSPKGLRIKGMVVYPEE